MKYITEADLRNVYRTAPFTTYETEPGTRLTPGARQFLGDRGIRVPDEIPAAKRFGDSGAGGKKPLYFWRQEETMVERDADSISADAAETAAATDSREGDERCPEPKDLNITPEKKALLNRLKSAQALFLESGLQFKEHDVLLAQRIFVMERCLAGLTADEETCLLPCQACTGICPDNFSEDMEDCFEITSFHVQSDRGMDLIRLHRLRCLLRELGLSVEQELGAGKSRELHQVINGLSQLICQLFGGNTCQKKE